MRTQKPRGARPVCGLKILLRLSCGKKCVLLRQALCSFARAWLVFHAALTQSSMSFWHRNQEYRIFIKMPREMPWGAYRCGHPAQQHGRRFPFARSSHVRLMWSRRVSDFFTEITQQIHSLRASGVMLFQAACTASDTKRAARRSSGTLCATPVARCCPLIYLR